VTPPSATTVPCGVPKTGWPTEQMAKTAVKNLFRFRLTNFPVAELDFIRYVCMVDDTRARSVLGYAPQHNLEATLRAVDQERWVA